jgi:hypothetical protein
MYCTTVKVLEKNMFTWWRLGKPVAVGSSGEIDPRFSLLLAQSAETGWWNYFSFSSTVETLSCNRSIGMSMRCVNFAWLFGDDVSSIPNVWIESELKWSSSRDCENSALPLAGLFRSEAIFVRSSLTCYCYKNREHALIVGVVWFLTHETHVDGVKMTK